MFTLTYLTQLQYYTTHPPKSIYLISTRYSTQPLSHAGKIIYGLGRTSFFFAAARSSETAAVADYFLAVRTDGERNATFSQFPHDIVLLIYAIHKHEEFALSQKFYDHTLAEIWMLPNIYKITD
jgi:hypothetical protein